GDAPRACFSGSAELAGKGACVMGTQACVESVEGEQVSAAWGPCEGEGSPSTEVCDGNDNDCNGVADDGCGCADGTTQQCSTACGVGDQVCMGGQWGPCDAPQPAADGSCPFTCDPTGAPPTAWEVFDFTFHPATTPCAGARYVRYMDEYGLWVGAMLCSPVR